MHPREGYAAPQGKTDEPADETRVTREQQGGSARGEAPAGAAPHDKRDDVEAALLQVASDLLDGRIGAVTAAVRIQQLAPACSVAPSHVASNGVVQALLNAIRAIPPDSVDAIEKAVAEMSKVSVAAYFRGRGINQAESAMLEVFQSLPSSIGEQNAAPQVPVSASLGAQGEGAVSRPRNGEPLSPPTAITSPVVAAPLLEAELLALEGPEGYVSLDSAERLIRQALHSAMASIGWISVKDRLPTEENETCVIGNDGVAWGVHPWKLDTNGNGAGWLDVFEGVLYRPGDVTHWLPLPPVPTESRSKA